MNGWSITLGGCKGRTNQKNLVGDRFQLIVPSLPMNKLAKQDLVILIVIFVALRLRGTPGVMDGWCTTLVGGWGGVNKINLIGDRFQVTVLLFTKLIKQRSGYFDSIFFHFKALMWAPGVIDWWYTTHRGWQCKTYKKNLTGDTYQMTVCLSTISHNNS